jgi:hypothetical protein
LILNAENALNAEKFEQSEKIIRTGHFCQLEMPPHSPLKLEKFKRTEKIMTK